MPDDLAQFTGGGAGWLGARLIAELRRRTHIISDSFMDATLTGSGWLLRPLRAARGIVPVCLTAFAAGEGTGDVFADGRHKEATDTEVTIKVGVLASGEILPTTGDYAWFDAHQEYWDVGGEDKLLWTIQPEIWR